MNTPNPEVMTVDELAERLEISRASAYKGVKSGEIPAIRIGHRWIVLRKAVDRLLEPAGTESLDAPVDEP